MTTATVLHAFGVIFYIVCVPELHFFRRMATISKTNFFATTPGRRNLRKHTEVMDEPNNGCRDRGGSHRPRFETKLDQIMVMLTEQGRSIQDLQDRTVEISTQIEKLQGSVKCLEEKFGAIQQLDSTSKRPLFRVRTPAELSVRKTNLI